VLAEDLYEKIPAEPHTNHFVEAVGPSLYSVLGMVREVPEPVRADGALIHNHHEQITNDTRVKGLVEAA
jgi:hypothetical protein